MFAAYGVSNQTSGNGKAVTVSPNGASATADSAGVLLLTF
jgi:hypothetical protein